MISRRSILVMVTALTGLVSAHAEDWVHYQNDRFGTFISYPAAVFSRQQQSDNDDGRTFIADDGGRLVVFGRYNVTDQTLKEIETDLAGPDYNQVTYRGHGKRWFVLSGKRKGEAGESIFYEKYVMSPDSKTIHAMILVYPLNHRQRYDNLVKRLESTFGPLD